MKVFAIVLVAAVLVQLAAAHPAKKCGRRDASDSRSDSSDSDEKETHQLDREDRILIRSGSSHGRITRHQESSEEEEKDCGCNKRRQGSSSEESNESGSPERKPKHDDKCKIVHKAKVVRTSPCETSQKIYLHRQPPIYVRPPPSRIFINHPPVVVRQPPVILHHQSRSPVLVKPILIKEREVAAKPVLFKISKPDSKVHVSKCENPKVHISGGCGCEREHKEKPCH